MEMVNKNFNNFSKGASSAIFLFLLIIAVVLIASSTPNIFAQSETQPREMNASILQVIGITVSGNLSTGIFFTNKTAIGTQIPIEIMTDWNNATANYWKNNNATEYYVTAASGNKVDIVVCHCGCEDLKCKNSTQCGTSSMPLQGSGTGEGVGWVNGTVADLANHTPSYRFPGKEQYQVVAGSLSPSNNIYLRYWLDPYPNSTPSGPYNTTYVFKAVEIGQSCGSCTC
ncbi:MAG: hypothetical protein QW412_02115 [Candidatus Aenigmatarchaeota archaeon]